MYKESDAKGYGSGSTPDKYEGVEEKQYEIAIEEAKQDSGSIRQKAIELFADDVMKKSGAIGSRPIVYKGRVYVGCSDYYFYALDANTGELEWKFKCNGIIMSYAHAAGGAIYFTSQDKCVYAITPDGRLLWKFDRKSPMGSSPVFCENVVYTGTGWKDGQGETCMHALDAKSGELKWKFRTDGPNSSIPSIANNTLFFGSGDRYLYAVSTDGALRWKFLTSDGIDVSPCIMDEKGNEVWSLNKNLENMPHISKGTIYFGSWDNNVYALTLEGKEAWRYRTHGPVMFSSPTVHKGVVYIGSMDNHLYAIDAFTGKLKWKFKANMPVIADPIVYKDTVYVGSVDKHLYALSLDGQLKWKFETNGYVVAAVSISNEDGDETIYFASFDGYIRALSLEGKLLWELRLTSMETPDIDVITIASQISVMNRRILRLWKPETIGKSHFPESLVFQDHVTLGNSYNSMNPYMVDTPYTHKGSYERARRRPLF